MSTTTKTGEELIQERRQHRLACEALVKKAGADLYDTLDDNEKTAVRIGMLPHEKTTQAEAKLIADNPELLEIYSTGDIGRLMAVGAMDACNNRGPGMIC